MNLRSHTTHHANCGCSEAVRRIAETLDKLALQRARSNYEKAQAILIALDQP